MKHYFAYGSNMSARRIRYRLGWAPSRVSAHLSDYVLSFNKQSLDGGKANIQSSLGDLVEGILYSLNEADLEKFDIYEGVHENHYERKNIQVNDLNGHFISAIAYVAIKTGPESRPTREYLNFLLEGEHLLSAEYITKLEDSARTK